MSKYRLITIIQLKEIFDFRKMFNKENKKKSASFIVALVFFCGIFVCLSFLYNIIFGQLLASEGKVNILPSLMFSMTSVITLFLTIFKVKGTIFGSRDYETLLSMPIKPSVIVASKITVLYLYEVVFTLIIMIPANIVYVFFEPSAWLSLIPSFVLMLFIPIIPIIIASSLGFLISLVSEKLRFKNIIQIALYIALIGGIMAFSMSSANQSQQADMISNLALSMSKMYPLTDIYLKGCIELNIWYLVLFLAINLGLFALFCFVIGKGYKKINQLILSVGSHRKYVEKALKSEGQFKALFKKEIKKLFQTPIYLLNTIVGGVLAVVMSIIFVIQFASLESNQLAEIVKSLGPYIAIALVFMLGMTSTTCVSISLEGNNFWIIKSSPIDYKKYFLAKLLVNELVIGTCALIAPIIFVIGFKMTGFQAVFTVIFPVLFTIMTGLLGLIMNLMYPKMKWITEQAAVKNSASMILCMLIGMGLAVVFGALFFACAAFNIVIVAQIASLVIVLAAIYTSYYLLVSKGAKWISKIDA